MPTRITHFLHDSTVTGSETLGTTFDTADVHVHDLQAFLPAFQKDARNYRGLVEGIHVRLTVASGAPTKVTIRLCSDAAGDIVLVPDTEATLVGGITTSATKSAAYSVKIPLFQRLNAPGNGSLYLFAKVDAGTATFSESSITWME